MNLDLPVMYKITARSTDVTAKSSEIRATSEPARRRSGRGASAKLSGQ